MAVVVAVVVAVVRRDDGGGGGCEATFGGDAGAGFRGRLLLV